MLTCAGCHKAIIGEYVNALGVDWHPGCFVCAGCGRPMGETSFVEHDGQPYHAACYHEQFSPRCAGCGLPISGQYTNALGRSWHPEHFTCTYCGKPFAGDRFYDHNGAAYCEHDYNVLFSAKCDVCGEPLRGIYSVNLWGDNYCERHHIELAKCYSCGRPISKRLTGGGVRYEDGRRMCNLCRHTAVDDSGEGERIVREVRRAMSGWGMDLRNEPTPLRLTNQNELTQRSTRTYASDPSGMACTRVWTRGGQTVRREVEEILILHGLPREHFAAVTAHELGHAWLFTNSFPELPPIVEEGLCELCVYLWLLQQKTPEARYRQQVMDSNKDPVYGAGFHAARSALENRTLPRLLEYAKQHKRFP